MTLSERRNVVAFETFNQELFNFIAVFYSSCIPTLLYVFLKGKIVQSNTVWSDHIL